MGKVKRGTNRIKCTWCSYTARAKKVWSSITLEPGIFLHTLSMGIMFGPAIQTNLLLWKVKLKSFCPPKTASSIQVCHVELDQDETVCNNLDLDEHSLTQIEVQKVVNNFNIVSNLLGTIPQIFYTLFAGALSDKYGRKPLIYGPMIGFFLSAVIDSLHYTFIR